jgi:hypothetical protein
MSRHGDSTLLGYDSMTRIQVGHVSDCHGRRVAESARFTDGGAGSCWTRSVVDSDKARVPAARSPGSPGSVGAARLVFDGGGDQPCLMAVFLIQLQKLFYVFTTSTIFIYCHDSPSRSH